MLLVLAGCGTETESTRTSSKTSFVSDTGSSYVDLDEIEDEYKTGWNEAVDEVFGNSPNGYLYYDGEQYSPEDFYDQYSYDPSDYEDEDEAYSAGKRDALEAVFQSTPEGILCYGEDVYEEGDF